MIYEDFLTSEQLKGQTFDVILLLMNIFPSIPFGKLSILFQRVCDLLSDNGYWIFSTHKIGNNVFPRKTHHSGEILLHEHQGSIIGEFFD